MFCESAPNAVPEFFFDLFLPSGKGVTHTFKAPFSPNVPTKCFFPSLKKKYPSLTSASAPILSHIEWNPCTYFPFFWGGKPRMMAATTLLSPFFF